MNLEMVMQELEALGKERMKKMYISNGAHEPLFGVATGAMKPIAKKIKINQPLAEELYATGNYDAMYFAGIIADPKAMTESDFERWMDASVFLYAVRLCSCRHFIRSQILHKKLLINGLQVGKS